METHLEVTNNPFGKIRGQTGREREGGSRFYHLETFSFLHDWPPSLDITLAAPH